MSFDCSAMVGYGYCCVIYSSYIPGLIPSVKHQMRVSSSKESSVSNKKKLKRQKVCQDRTFRKVSSNTAPSDENPKYFQRFKRL